jgi:hypothetical protein
MSSLRFALCEPSCGPMPVLLAFSAAEEFCQS